LRTLRSAWVWLFAVLGGCNAILGIEPHERADSVGGAAGASGAFDRGGEAGQVSPNTGGTPPSSGGAPLSTGGVQSVSGGAQSVSGGAQSVSGGVQSASGGAPEEQAGQGGADLGTAGDGGEAGVERDVPNSCRGLPDTCGPNHESCCETRLVRGGVVFYLRDPDADQPDGRVVEARVSDFQLDRFEVTHARFQNFIASGWRPTEGEGKHRHLNGGRGLVDLSQADGYETGWQKGWSFQPGTCVLKENDPTPRGDEPARCIRDWLEAYAFCIWDGGFLPSEAEWYYAASGGVENRMYPWPGFSIDCNKANYNNSACPDNGGPARVGSRSPQGDGRWEQADLSGSVWEWVLDFYDADGYLPCDDCMNGADGGLGRSLRGGSFENPLPEDDESEKHKLETTHRSYIDPNASDLPPDFDAPGVGFRCARPPPD
jgi:sulfatase modifying factor 1